MSGPIKRHEALQDLSRDHHEALLVCFKIRQGLKADVQPERIMSYLRHFYQQHLLNHFREEEEILFPVIGNTHPMVQTALEQHKRLRELFTSEVESEPQLQEIEKLLKEHVRFEERQLFNEIERQAGEQVLRKLNERLHQHHPERNDNWSDKFWEK